MNFSYYIAKRYFLSKSKNNAINIISYLSIIGIFGTSLALLIVLSAFGGLKDFSLSFANEYDPDLKVFPTNSKRIIIDNKLLSEIKNIEGIEQAALIVEEKTLLNFKNKNVPAILKAIDSNYMEVSKVHKNVFVGQWLDTSNPYQVVIGNGLSNKLNVSILDQTSNLNFIVPKPGKGQVLMPEDAFRSLPTVVRGIFSISEEYNNAYVFSNLSLAKQLLKYEEDEYSAIEISTNDKADIEQIKMSLSSIINQNIEVKTRLQLNDQLYKMLNSENLMVYLISTLVIIIALFNLIGSIIMAIIDKKEHIKTLSHLGVKKSEINLIFFLQGVITSVVGSILGVLVGCIIIFLQLKFSLFYITTSLPYPVKFSFLNVIIVISTTIFFGVLASKIASSRAGKLA